MAINAVESVSELMDKALELVGASADESIEPFNFAKDALRKAITAALVAAESKGELKGMKRAAVICDKQRGSASGYGEYVWKALTEAGKSIRAAASASRAAAAVVAKKPTPRAKSETEAAEAKGSDDAVQPKQTKARLSP